TPRTRAACSTRPDRAPPSKMLAQVHARVQRGDLFGIAVEWQRLQAVAEQCESVAGDAAFGLLAPARMVDRRIDVRIEAVFVRRRRVPRRRRLAFDEFDAHDRLDALEPVLPRH